jgi:hypothetical protein
MKRKALLIGNTYGLQGVKVDLNNFRNFLTSPQGGAWNNDEIVVMSDPTLEELKRKIGLIRFLRPDYAVVMFSGHGEQKRDTSLVINKSGEEISENEFNEIADRQLSIFDCCRAYPERLVKSGVALDTSAVFAMMESHDDVRARYDKRIMQARAQHAKLYSCSKGQYSYDTAEGGIYLVNLLNASRNLGQDQFKLVGVAHQEAVPTTQRQAEQQGGKQDPDSFLIKCIPNDSLIIAIR